MKQQPLVLSSHACWQARYQRQTQVLAALQATSLAGPASSLRQERPSCATWDATRQFLPSLESGAWYCAAIQELLLALEPLSAPLLEQA